MEIDKDAFSSGQIGSKLWLCEELEKTGWISNHTYIYGNWHGMSAFLLLSRDKFKVTRISGFDIDPSCEIIADMINENWVWQDWKFKAYTADCNQLSCQSADLIINTSSEHFDSLNWWNNIPTGTRVIVQGNNMPHSDHRISFGNISEFKEYYQITTELFTGVKEFNYPDWSFKRFMLIGIK